MGLACSLGLHLVRLVVFHSRIIVSAVVCLNHPEDELFDNSRPTIGGPWLAMRGAASLRRRNGSRSLETGAP